MTAVGQLRALREVIITRLAKAGKPTFSEVALRSAANGEVGLPALAALQRTAGFSTSSLLRLFARAQRATRG